VILPGFTRSLAGRPHPALQYRVKQARQSLAIAR
jgi:hypothetical protein